MEEETQWQRFYKKYIVGCPATRAVVAMMIFFATWVNYMMRVNMSVNIIAMVPDKPESEESESLRSYEVVYGDDPQVFSDFQGYLTKLDSSSTFTWTTRQQAYVLSGYFWGYAVACGVGGFAAEYFGPKRVVVVTMALSAVMTLASPAAAKVSYLTLVFVRVICGVGGGFLFPSLQAMIARWAPPDEKGKFLSVMMGGSIGTVVTWSLSGPIIEALGWDSAFYIIGCFAVLWCLLWLYLVYDTPLQHPRISQTEKDYIVNAIGTKVNYQAKKAVPPFKKIFTSIPFLALTLLQFGSNWGLYFVMISVPKFMSSCLKFNLTASGVLSSLPYLTRMISSLMFGALGDWIVSKKLVRPTFMRKFFCLFSHILPGVLLIAIAYSGASAAIVVVLLMTTLGGNGAICLTSLQNGQDLAPNYAGTLFGIANGIGNSAGFINPLVTAHFTEHGNGFNEWRPVFVICACIYISSAIFFIVFGSAKTQAWNYPDGVIPTQEPPGYSLKGFLKSCNLL